MCMIENNPTNPSSPNSTKIKKPKGGVTRQPPTPDLSNAPFFASGWPCASPGIVGMGADFRGLLMDEKGGPRARRGEGVSRRPPHAVGRGLDRFWKFWEGGLVADPPIPVSKNTRLSSPGPALPAHCTSFPETPTRKWYRKKIPEIPGNVPDVPGTGRALRADVPGFPETPTRKWYRKKIPEIGPEVPGLINKSAGYCYQTATVST